MGEHRIKNQKLQVWISPEMKKQLNETAKRMGLTPSELTRQAIMHYLIVIPKEKEEGG